MKILSHLVFGLLLICVQALTHSKEKDTNIVFFIFTSHTTHKRVTVQENTWLNDLNYNIQYVVVSDTERSVKNLSCNKGNSKHYRCSAKHLIVPYAKADYNMVPMKLTYAILYIAKKLISDNQWFYFVDDDAFVWPTRLEQFLSSFNSSIPLVIGNEVGYPNQINSTIDTELEKIDQEAHSHFKNIEMRMRSTLLAMSQSSSKSYTGNRIAFKYPQGGCGFAVSQAAITKLAETIQRGGCPSGPGGFGDVRIGMCMSAAKPPISFVDTKHRQIPYCHAGVGENDTMLEELLSFHFAQGALSNDVWNTNENKVLSCLSGGCKASTLTRTFCNQMKSFKRS